MNEFDRRYKKLIRKTLAGELKNTRSGVRACMVGGASMKHALNEGFPLTTLKKTSFSLIASELEFNIRGLTDKRWLQERNNHVWDPWCNPKKVPYGRDEVTKKKMREERDLGPTYGFQWRHFGAHYEGSFKKYTGKGVDQLSWLIQKMKKDPESKRLIVSCWNPMDLPQMSIPPCPFAFELSVFGKNLHLTFFQRSVDLMLGFPFDFAEHALLLHLLAKETGLQAGNITAYFGNVEIYETHFDSAKKLLRRKAFPLPSVRTKNFSGFFKWQYPDTKVVNYRANPCLKFDIAV